MSFSDSYLLDLGWLFFAAWSILVAVVSVAAFRNDVFRSRTEPDRARRSTFQNTPASK